jgi:hypothetical protein
MQSTTCGWVGRHLAARRHACDVTGGDAYWESVVTSGCDSACDVWGEVVAPCRAGCGGGVPRPCREFAPAGRPTSLARQRSRQESASNTAAQPRTERCESDPSNTSPACQDWDDPCHRSGHYTAGSASTAHRMKRQIVLLRRFAASALDRGLSVLACGRGVSALCAATLGARLGRCLQALFFGYFLPGQQKKVTRPAGADTRRGRGTPQQHTRPEGRLKKPTPQCPASIWNCFIFRYSVMRDHCSSCAALLRFHSQRFNASRMRVVSPASRPSSCGSGSASASSGASS